MYSDAWRRGASSPPQSSGEELLSVATENVDCFHSGVTCRKSLLITVGGTFVAFDEDSGTPVRDSSSSYLNIMHEIKDLSLRVD